MRALWFGAGLLAATVVHLASDVPGVDPAGASALEGGERADVEALADAVVALDARLEAITLGCVWLPERERSVGVRRVQRVRPVQVAVDGGASGPGDKTGTRGTGPLDAGRTQTDE